MKFMIKPARQAGFALTLETYQYQNLWQAHGPALLAAFTQITGLSFQQRFITAHVKAVRQAEAGNRYRAMALPGDARSADWKFATMVHELSHRLFGGNGLGLYALGLYDLDETWGDIHDEIEHKHIYLFEYDVMKMLGEHWEQVCLDYEQNPARITPGSAHQKAWKWAMGLSFEERQRAVQWLAAKRTTRKNWKDWSKQPRASAEAWLTGLEVAANSTAGLCHQAARILE